MYYNKYYECFILKLKIHTSYCNMFHELIKFICISIFCT
jgi:hypothetical protein